MNPFDPLTLVAVAAVLILAALLASYIPAARAAREDPANALRYDAFGGLGGTASLHCQPCIRPKAPLPLTRSRRSPAEAF